MKSFKKELSDGETIVAAIVGVIVTMVLGAVIVWLVYGGFAIRFGWPALSYWDVLAAFIAIRLLVMK